MRICSLGSGSKGNSTLVQFGATTLMVDCGFGLRETIKRLEQLNTAPAHIDAILVTHEHQDHIGGVESVAAKFGLRVMMTEGTARGWKSRGRVTPEIIRADQVVSVGDIQVLPVPVPHDAREPVQFVFEASGKKAGILTDLGSTTEHIVECYQGCQMVFIEANHDIDMLNNGSYPFSLKRRVGGDWGHLNNQQTAHLLSALERHASIEQIVVGHISEQNNHIERVEEVFTQNSIPLSKVTFVSQTEPLSWLELH